MRFLPVSATFDGLPVMHITLWFHTYSIIKVFSFSTIFMKKIAGLGDDFVPNYNS